MTNWKNFEDECLSYLINKYGEYFKGTGKSDSTISDIHFIGDDSSFFIEAKMPNSQSGQFVAHPEDSEKTFQYSTKNKSKQNIYTNEILNYMSKNYDLFKSPSTKGQEINMNPSVFFNWIIHYYQDKGVKFIITQQPNVNEFIILKLENLEKFFHVSATYRVKKSGSSDLSKKNIPDFKDALNNTGVSDYKIEGTNVISDENLDNIKVTGNTRNYLLREHNEVYKVKQLSNTKNANIIFSLVLKDNIDPTLIDKNRKEFERYIS